MNGPPKEDWPPKGPTNSFSSHHATATASEYIAGIRRREASRRAPKLEHLDRSDPWWYAPPDERGYESAAHHLLDLGLTPAPNHEGLRVMWKRGGSSRRAAELIAERWAA